MLNETEGADEFIELEAGRGGQPARRVSLTEFGDRIKEAERYSPLARLTIGLSPLWLFLLLAGIAVFMVVMISWLVGGGAR